MVTGVLGIPMIESQELEGPQLGLASRSAFPETNFFLVMSGSESKERKETENHN